MHRIAEEGIAAHWSTKEGARSRSATSENFSGCGSWSTGRKSGDPREFMEILKVDLYP